MARWWLAVAVLIALTTGCGARQPQYEPLTPRGQQCLDACRDRYQSCLATCFASTNCMELCIGEQNDCFGKCPDVKRE